MNGPIMIPSGMRDPVNGIIEKIVPGDAYDFTYSS